MRLITRFEMAAKNKNDLRALLRYAFNSLARSDSDTHQRRNALTSIENIQAEICSRSRILSYKLRPPSGGHYRVRTHPHW